MNLDANVQKIIFAVLRRWKLIVLFALIGALVGYFYTANFTTLTYSSKVEFLAYATTETMTFPLLTQTVRLYVRQIRAK